VQGLWPDLENLPGDLEQGGGGGGGGLKIIALVDLRENNGHVVAIVDDNENIVQFDNFDEIEKLKGNHPLSGFPWLAVDIDSEICWCMEGVK
jgi:hypothetical protein